MNGAACWLLLGLFCFSLSEGYPLSPGSYTDLRFYRILGSRPFPRASQWLPSKRSLIFPSFFNQGAKRDGAIDAHSDFDPSDLAIKFGKRSPPDGPPSGDAKMWGGFGKRRDGGDYDAFTDRAADLAVRFG